MSNRVKAEAGAPMSKTSVWKKIITMSLLLNYYFVISLVHMGSAQEASENEDENNNNKLFF